LADFSNLYKLLNLYKLRKDLEEPPALAKLGWGSRVSGYAGFVTTNYVRARVSTKGEGPPHRICTSVLTRT